MGGHLTARRRIVVILTVAMAMVATMAITPAGATSGGDDLEAVRSQVVDTYNYKIGALADLKAQTDNADRKAIYAGGINELTSIRDSDVASANTTDALWALKDRAHSIYHATVDAANNVPKSPAEELAYAQDKARSKIASKINALESWIEGCDDPNAQAIVAAGIASLEALYPLVDAAETADAAYALKARAHDIYNQTMAAANDAKGDDPKDQDPKEEQPKEKSEEEKAAEALAKARRATQAFLDRKVAILRSAAAAALIPAVVDVYAGAAEEVANLSDDAKSAKSTAELKDVEARALAIYEAAKEAAMAIRDGNEDADPEHTLEAYLDRIINYVKTTTEAAARTQEDSPSTFADLVDAKQTVLARVEAVREVAETGNGLAARWEELNNSLTEFRLALIRHYIALGEPMLISGIQIPG